MKLEELTIKTKQWSCDEVRKFIPPRGNLVLTFKWKREFHLGPGDPGSFRYSQMTVEEAWMYPELAHLLTFQKRNEHVHILHMDSTLQYSGAYTDMKDRSETLLSTFSIMLESGGEF